MFWIVVGAIGCIIFVAINAFIFNPPESLLKSVLDHMKDKKGEDGERNDK